MTAGLTVSRPVTTSVVQSGWHVAAVVDRHQLKTTLGPAVINRTYCLLSDGDDARSIISFPRQSSSYFRVMLAGLESARPY